MRHPRHAHIPPIGREAGRQAFILDVDTGIDDSLALLYAAGHPEIELVGVTACAGNVGLDDVVHNTLGILSMLGRSDVEVARGAEGPVARALEITPETHGPHGIGYATVHPSFSVSERSAVQLIVESARSRPGEITLVTLGPLTNLAAAVLAEPELPVLLRDVFVMGGTFSESGNVLPRVEWNMHVDPEAAKIVFHQWSTAAPRGARPITVMGLDVTETSRIYAGDLASIAASIGSSGAAGVAGAAGAADLTTEPTDAEIMATPFGNPVLDFARDALRFYFEFHEMADGFYGAHVHDPFVVGAAFDPALVESIATVVDVELGGRYTEGETIADWRGHFDKPVNAFVAVKGDGEAFGRRLHAAIATLAARAARP